MGWFSGWFRRGAKQTAPGETATRFQYAGGRRYLADMPYVLPKDNAEINRLDFQHFMLRHELRGNFLAPVGVPRDVLDVGCGTGRWAMEIALRFPDANVFGLDTVPPPADQSLGNGMDRRPDNYTFVQGNALEPLNFPPESFDFVHMRLLYSAIPAQRWPGLVADLARVTRRGGWVESVEAGVPPTGGPAMDWFHQLTLAGGQAVGLDMTIGARVGQLLAAAGLRDIQTRTLPIPLGPRGGRVGTLMETNLYAILAAGKALSAQRGLVNEAEYDAKLAQWRQEVAEGEAVFPYFIAFGRKP